MGTVTKLLGFDEPKIIEMANAPDLYCDLAVVKDFGEIMRIYLCKRIAQQLAIEQAATLHMPRGGFLTSLGRATTQFLIEKH